MDFSQGSKLMKQRFMANNGKCPKDMNICYPNMLTFSQRGRNLIMSFEKHNYRKKTLIYI